MSTPAHGTPRQTNSMCAHLAGWIYEFAAQPMPSATAERTRAILLDSLACALYARDDDKAMSALRAVEKLGGNADCTVIGTSVRTSLPLAVLANAVRVRTLDFNDTYAGPRQLGHPSDTIASALAAAELADRSGADLMQAIRVGYEIYCRILDLDDPETPWDHVTVSGLVTAAMIGWLLRLPEAQLAHALSLAAMHCATLGEVRVGQVSAAKSIASAVVSQTAAMVTLLAAEGMTGPPHGLEGPRGYAALLLKGVDFGQFFTSGRDTDRLVATGLKPYPCFALGQGPISAAIELRNQLGPADPIERLEISLANTGPARLRLKDSHGRTPDSREAADHSIYCLVALALLDGRISIESFEADRWRADDVRGLIARMEATTDPALQPTHLLPCRLRAALSKGGEVVIERKATPGSPALPLSWTDVTAKFRNCAAATLSPDAQAAVIGHVEKLDTIPARLLMQSLVAR